MIVGVKCWYADGSKHMVPISGQTHETVLATIAALPTIGVQLVMVYFDDFSTVTCPNGHNQPFRPDQRCTVCGATILDKAVRYRRIVQGNDFYFVVYDTIPPPNLRDWLIGQTNNSADLAKYPGAVALTGSFVNDTAYKAYVEEAMNDFMVSEFGLPLVPGTTDR